MCCDWPVKKAIVDLPSLKCTSGIKLSLLGALSTASQTLLIKPKLSYVCDAAYLITSSAFTVLVHYLSVPWNFTLTKCQGTVEICLLYQAFVIIIENLDLTNIWENKQNVHYIKV